MRDARFHGIYSFRERIEFPVSRKFGLGGDGVQTSWKLDTSLGLRVDGILDKLNPTGSCIRCSL